MASFGTFDIKEDDPRWPAISRLVRPLDMLDIVSTEFTRGELMASKCCAVSSGWHEGYPQPEGDGSYLTKAYDIDNYCEACGIGLEQKAPFRMKGEPKWGNRSFLSLNWIYDELFTTPEIWKSVFEPIGVERLPVWRPVKDKPLDHCVQLVIKPEVELNIPDGHRLELCKSCGRVRYAYFERGPCPGPIVSRLPPLFKSVQYFGSGHSSHKQVMVSAELYRELDARKLTGLSFAACA